VKISYFS